MIDLVANPSEIVFDPEPHTYSYRGKVIPSVTQVRDAAGLGDDFSHIPARVLALASERGRMVHAATHYIDEGDLNPKSVDRRIAGYVEAYRRFHRECRVKVIHAEKRYVSIQYVLAGQIDLVCFINGVRSIVDRKTGQIESVSLGIQTALYKLLYNDIYPANPITKRFGLKLTAFGKYKLVPCDNDLDYAAAVDALAFTHAQRKMDQWIKYYRPTKGDNNHGERHQHHDPAYSGHRANGKATA